MILSVVGIRKVSSTVRLDDAAPKLPPILRQMGARSDSRDGTVEIEERKKPADREREREGSLADKILSSVRPWPG